MPRKVRVIRSVRSMQRAARELVTRKKTVGLVPTMGYLHDGHLELIKRAKKQADTVIVSIFVNPTQFGPSEDFERYPRDEKGDVDKIKQAGGDIAFVPKVEQMFPRGFNTRVEVEKITQILEGETRPTHFKGVTTIVAKLFNICRPDVAVFGMKDYQQAMVLKRMVRDLDYPIKMVIAPTVREEDGLAMSSRNAYFTEEQRWEAVCLYYALRSARDLVKSGVTETERIADEMTKVILATCPGAEIDYIAFTDMESLQSTETVVKNTVCSLAARIHGVRLIDNMKLM